MIEKKSLVGYLKSHLVTVILTAVVLFLLNKWLGSFDETVEDLRQSLSNNSNAIAASTASWQGLKQSVDSLRWHLNDIDEDIVDKINDHETRLRDLEKKP